MELVCARVARGELVKFAAIAEGTTAENIRAWGGTDEFSTLYARARESQAHALAEHALEIADGEDALTVLYERAIEQHEDDLEDDQKYKIIQALKANLLNRDKMRLDARKWLTSKIAPKLYGDKLALEGSDGGPVVVKVVYSHE